VVFMPVPTEDDAQILHAITTLRDPDVTDLAARRTNALRHSVILGAGAVQKVNEIVMAYRAHRSALFPLFAKWDGNAKRFNALARTTLQPTGAYVTESGEWHDR
jgi:hypothetical protein